MDYILQLKDIESPNDLKAGPNYMLLTRKSLHIQRHTQTESEWMEQDIPHKQNPKENKIAILYQMKQILNQKQQKKRPRRLSYNGKGLKAARRNNTCRYIYPQYCSTQIYKAHANRSKGRDILHYTIIRRL